MTGLSNSREKSVPIFRIIAIFTFLSITYGQRIDSTLYANLEAKGEWKSYYRLNESKGYDFISKPATIDSVDFREDGSIKLRVLRLLFRPLLGQTDQNQVMSQLEVIRSAYPFINDQTLVSFARFGEKQIAAVVDFHPQFKSEISGIIGASKGNDGKWIKTGEFDIHLENSWKQGTSMDVEWRQPTAKSRYMNFSYERPFLFSLPLGARIGFDQDFVEKTYVSESSMGAITGLWPMGIWMFGGKKESTLDLILDESYKTESIMMGFSADRRNNRWLASDGNHWESMINLGRYSDGEGIEKSAELEMEFGQYKTWKESTLYFSVWASGNWVDGRQLPYSKQVKFGGTGSLRGYHENQFNADWVIVQSSEWIMGDMDRSQLFLFTDIPFADGLNIQPGYGLGFRQYNGKIMINIAAGFSGTLSDAKIHLKFSSNL